MARGRSRPPTQRQLRVGEILRHALAEILERETFQDKDLQNVILTITEVAVSSNLKHAIVYVAPLGGGCMPKILDGLERVKSFLRRELSNRVQLRYLPSISFLADTTLDEAHHIESLLQRPDVIRDLEKGDHESKLQPDQETYKVRLQDDDLESSGRGS